MPPKKDPDASLSVPAFFGAELRWKREKAGLTLQEVADATYHGFPYLSQIERAERRMSADLARELDRLLYTDGFFTRRCEDVRRAASRGHADYFSDVAELEKFAATIEEWGPLLVPGLLQTAEYARALVRNSLPRVEDDEVEQKVNARLARPRLFEKQDRPIFWVIVSELVIRQRVLPSRQMAELLEHMAAVVRAVRGTFQILPLQSAAHPFLAGTCRIMTFADAPPVVYTEALHNGQTIDDPGLVRRYRESYDLLKAVAMSPEASMTMLETAAEEYRHDSPQHA